MNPSTTVLNQLSAIVGSDQIRINEPMSAHTTFRVGGPASFYASPRTAAEIVSLVKYCRTSQLPYYILGNGSNLLVSDQGYDGVIIQLSQNLNAVSIEGQTITAQAGALLSRIASEALKCSLTGLEFAAGIPGTLGGAVVMNAGAYGGQMKDVLVCATLMDQTGNVRTLSVDELALGYRTSIIANQNDVVLEAVLQLREGNAQEIKAQMDMLAAQRRDKQPLEYGSAGSTFKRPEGYFAGKLIQDAGLRGYRIGDAQVSEKHCGFIINRGHATAAEIYQLIREVQRIVLERHSVALEPEVKLLGRF